MKYLFLFLSLPIFATPMMDMIARVESSTVALYGNNMQCSGVQVHTLHGKIVILSAAHCRNLTERGKIRAMTEDVQAVDVKLIAVDNDADLMLLTGMTDDALDLADTVKKGDLVITATHGMNQPLFSTFGAVIEDRLIDSTGRPMLNNEDRKDCLKYKINHIDKFMFLDYCFTKSILTITSAWAKGGASGGAVINEQGQLIGIISVGSENMSGMVRLSDIKTFLQKY